MRIHANAKSTPASGYEFVRVAIDDASRLAYAEVLADQKGISAADFFGRARSFFQTQGISRIERVMTDNGSCYVARRFRRALDRHQIQHIRTRPYRPETDGKAERFIQTLLRGWAYNRPVPGARPPPRLSTAPPGEVPYLVSCPPSSLLSSRGASTEVRVTVVRGSTLLSLCDERRLIRPFERCRKTFGE